MNTSKSTGTFLDSSVMVNTIVETELTKFTDRVFERFPLITSETVIDESVYVIIRKLFAERAIKNRFDVKRKLQTPMGEEIIEEAITLVMNLIEEKNVAIVRDADIYLTLATMKKYLLLPHDAKIISTMLQNGIRELATFDEDYRVVPGIVLLPEDYWRTEKD
ncbi:PIN domain-containing protein [Thermococcus sp.]|uniref:PIN domain-containing protein n=1 Tax=Thermococcus sp. TaxID=35749 RepID=UPI002617BD11|nr:PIN domain-containing protein [Thermococcus sp.]